MKGKRNVIKILVLLTTLCASIITIVVLANSELKIVDMSYLNEHSAILYSDNRLLYWSNEKDKVFENVEKYYLGYDSVFEPYILTKDGNLTYETKEGKKTKTNIKDFIGLYDEDIQIILYLDNNQNLYFETYGENFDVPESIPNVSKLYFNEKDESIAFLSQGKLYVFFVNTYEKLNNTVDKDLLILYEPRIVAENVKDFGNSYYITNDNELYAFGELLSKNVKSVDNVISANSYEKLYEITTQSNEKKYLFTVLNTDITSNGYNYEISYNEVNISESVKNVIEVDDYTYMLTESNILYEYDEYDNTLERVNERIKEIGKMGLSLLSTNILVTLNEDNEVYIECKSSSCYLSNFNDIIGNHRIYKNEKIRLLKNVETIKYLDKMFILMTDKSVFRFGSNSDNEFRDKTLLSTQSFVKINELINNNSEITTNQLLLNTSNKIEIDSSSLIRTLVIPDNSTDKMYSYNIEDENVIQYVDEYSLIHGIREGNTKVCATLNTNENIKDCINVSVFPRLQGIEIEQGENIVAESYEVFKISILKNPINNFSELNIEFENDDNFSIRSYYYDEETEEYIYANENEFYVYGYNGGTYELMVYDYDTGYSDTITIDIIEKVEHIEPIIPNANFDGINNAYIYLKKSNTLDVSYDIYYDTATNKDIIWSSSDDTIASVDQNGLITAYKPGRVKITMTAADGRGAKRIFNVIVIDSVGGAEMAGDVNQDESVDILDVIKLRKYLAGLEDEL